jgi:hypothetical protein
MSRGNTSSIMAFTLSSYDGKLGLLSILFETVEVVWRGALPAGFWRRARPFTPWPALLRWQHDTIYDRIRFASDTFCVKGVYSSMEIIIFLLLRKCATEVDVKAPPKSFSVWGFSSLTFKILYSRGHILVLYSSHSLLYCSTKGLQLCWFWWCFLKLIQLNF